MPFQRKTARQSVQAVGGSPGEVAVVSATTAVEHDLQLAVYPNPAHDVVNVAVKGEVGACTGRVVDLMGREVLRGEMSGGGDLRHVSLSVSGVVSGQYFVVLVEGDGRVLGSEGVVVEK